MSKRLKVLMFGWEFPPFNSGGLGVACYGLTRSLIEEGVEITFVLPKKFDLENDFLKIIFAQNYPLKLHYVDSALYEYITSSSYEKTIGKLGIYGSTLLEEVKNYASAARIIAENENFDIIHAHDWLSFLAGIEAKKVSKKPLVAHVHATEFDRTGGNNINQNVYGIEKLGMEKSNAIIAVSNLTKNTIVNNYAIKSDKVNVIHNGVDDLDTEDFEFDLETLKKKNKIVLFVGRLTLQKGPDYFLKSAKKVLEIDPNVIFLIAGSGDMKDMLVRETVTLGISDKVIFTGFLRDGKLRKIYQGADLFVMPSVSEPFGITALEALINHTPVIISKQSGASEVISHALKVDFWDIDDMANKILSVLKHTSLHTTLKENGYNEVQRVNWKESAKKTKELYNKLVRD